MRLQEFSLSTSLLLHWAMYFKFSLVFNPLLQDPLGFEDVDVDTDASDNDDCGPEWSRFGDNEDR